MGSDAQAVELLGVRATARHLEINASTVSRHLVKHPELNQGSGSHIKIDPEEFRRHRQENNNPARRDSHAGRLFGEGDEPEDLEEAAVGAGEPEGRGKKPKDLTYAKAKATREAILAQRARVDLDEKLEHLVPRAEVESAAFEAGQALQRDLLDLGPQLAERLAVMSDPREIATLIENEHRRVLAKLATALRSEGERDVAA